ncbi:MAG: alpha/beta hydrolase fold domain-containing protein [Myxococcales bacterium]|nr:alpha/beta hydrolase fold domain-containing protein [Myxococcales bacterium]
MRDFHPDLRLGRFMPPFPAGPFVAGLMQRLARRSAPPKVEGLVIEDIDVPGVSLRLYRPKDMTAAMPAYLWLHGGGFLVGQPEQDEANNIALALELKLVVAGVRYRLAPKHPAPAAVEDAWAALQWLAAAAPRLGIDPTRIAIGGASAGGGLAATLALVAHDRKDVRPAFQLLVYPMLDDRTATRTDLETKNVRVWTPASNHYAWSAYLGHPPGQATANPYAAAARREDLRGLPPAWIGVGTLDLFHDEDVTYAKRLEASGVPCELHLVPGAFHGFDAVFRKAGVTKAFWSEQVRVLRAALR